MTARTFAFFKVLSSVVAACGSRSSVRIYPHYIPLVTTYRFTSTCSTMYETESRGRPYTDTYRVFIKKDGQTISPWHDIPLFVDKESSLLNMVVEIPRWTNAKMELATGMRMNPIKQDIKKGKMRYVANVFPHKGYIWNYGCFPQTWEDPNVKSAHTNATGDNDPLDVCEIGQKIHPRGAVITVKVLGIMAMIDEGETDWKVIVIDNNDPLAASMNDIEDVERLMPGFLKATYHWFVHYKIPDGKPKNVFAFDGEAKNREFAMNIIMDTHNEWKSCVMQKTEAGINGENVSVEGSPCMISPDQANAVVQESPVLGDAEDLPESVEKSFFHQD